MTRINKLMAVANDPNATPEERAAYRAKAEELAAEIPAGPRPMARYPSRWKWTVETTYGATSTFNHYAYVNMVVT